KIKVKRQRDKQLGAIPKRQGKERSCNKRRSPDQSEIERCGLPEQSQAKSDLPGAAESEVTPCPGSENRKQGQKNSTKRGPAFAEATVDRKGRKPACIAMRSIAGRANR